MDTSRTFARRLYLLERQLFNVSTQVRLGFSSIEGGYIDGYDDDGNPTVIVGELPDGGTGTEPLGGPPPPKPTGFAFVGSIRSFVANWAGTFEGDVPAPMNLGRIEVHIGTSPTFIPDLIGPTGGASSTMKGTIETSRGGGLVIGGFDPPGGDPANYPDYFAVLVARSTSGKYSEPSDVIGPVKPVFITKIEMPDFSVTEADLDDFVVSADKIAEGAVRASKVAANAILAIHLQADEALANKLSANIATFGQAFANVLTADMIFANQAFAEKLAATMATFQDVFANKVTANMITVDALDGKLITGATLRTSASNPRMEFSSSGLTVYNSIGGVVAQLSTSGGSLTANYIESYGSLLAEGSVQIGGVSNPIYMNTSGTGNIDASGPIESDQSLSAPKIYATSPTNGSAIPNARWTNSSFGGELRYTDHANSSKRFKKFIDDLDVSAEVAYALRPVRFEWREKHRSPDRPRGYVDMGFIAEELQALGLDRWLGFDDKGLPSEVDYAKLTAVQQVAIRDLNRRETRSEIRLDELEAIVERLTSSHDA